MRAAKKFLKNSVAIGSELSSLSVDSLVRPEQLFAICYSDIVLKSPYGNLDICLNRRPRLMLFS